MSEKASYVSDSLEGVPLSEPFTAFRGNVEGVAFIGWKVLDELDKENKKVRKLEKDAKKLKEDYERKIKKGEEILEEFRRVGMELRGDEFKSARELVDKEMENIRGKLVEGEKWVGTEGVDAGPRRLMGFLGKAREVLMPMIFVFFCYCLGCVYT